MAKKDTEKTEKTESTETSLLSTIVEAAPTLPSIDDLLAEIEKDFEFFHTKLEEAKAGIAEYQEKIDKAIQLRNRLTQQKEEAALLELIRQREGK